MNRKILSVLVLVSLFLISGCLGMVVGAEGDPEPDPMITHIGTQVLQPNERAPVHRELPASPEAIIAENVGFFVADYEEIRLHNELVRDHSNLVSLGSSCTVNNVVQIDDSYAVTVECGHWYEFADGDRRGIADGAPYTITYTVGDDGHIEYAERELVL